MHGLRSLTVLATILLSHAAHAGHVARAAHGRHPHGQAPPAQVTGLDDDYQKVPTSIGYAIPNGPQSYDPSRSQHVYSSFPTGATNVTVPIPTGTASPGNNTIPRKPLPTEVRGVNAGNGFIVEKWMSPSFFDGTNATDQHSFDQTSDAAARNKEHWETYYTKEDFVAMKNWGLNAVRIPIGFWAYDNADTPYLKGADKYLERMVEWCRELGLWVLVDCHGSPGSQNGFDNSGQSGKAKWQSKANLDRSIEVLKIMAAKYGSVEYADVVYGLQLANEPISWDESKIEVTQEWTKRAYRAVRAAAKNKDLMIVMHDGFMGPKTWTDVGNEINGNNTSISDARFAVDTHLYQNQVQADKWLTQEKHIDKACNWTKSELLPQDTSKLPVIVGEFSAATDICANPDGSTLAGEACYIDGCQCANNVDIQYWQQPLKDATRKFFEAELEAFEKGAQGWFLWSWKGPGGWGMENLINNGVIGKHADDRKYHGQCA